MFYLCPEELSLTVCRPLVHRLPRKNRTGPCHSSVAPEKLSLQKGQKAGSYVDFEETTVSLSDFLLVNTVVLSAALKHDVCFQDPLIKSTLFRNGSF